MELSDLTDAALAEITAEFCDSEPEHGDTGVLASLVRAARRHGLLEGVTAHELAAENRHDEGFLITVEITDRITVSSPPLRWREVTPGPDAVVRRLLERIVQVAAGLRADFAAGAVLRDAPELVRVEELAQAARSLDECWAEDSRPLRDEEGDPLDGELRAYDELRTTYAIEAWEIATELGSSLPSLPERAPTHRS